MPDPQPPPRTTLTYETLPRPRELAIEEDEHSMIIRIPPPPESRLVVRLVAFGLLALFVIFLAAIGAGGRRTHWADWGRVAWLVIILGLGAIQLLASARQSRSWTMIEASAAELSVSLYDKEVWSHTRWPREEIKSIAATRGDLQWNFRRPRHLRIGFASEHRDLLHGLPMGDLERVAGVLRGRLGLA